MRDTEGRAALILALCLVVTVAYGALYYGFAVLITDDAAGADFSRALLSTAYGGAVVASGLAAVPVGRVADRAGVRWIITAGTLVAAAGLLGFSLAASAWQVLAVWWLVLGPAIAMTFYEPAYVAIQHAFGPRSRARAIGILTLTAGFSGPIFTPATAALVDALGWRDATRLFAMLLGACAPVAALAVRATPPPRPVRAPGAMRRATHLAHGRLGWFTAGTVLAYGALEAVVVHRVARFEEDGFGLATVTLWAAIAGLLTLPGRFVLPVLARRVRGTDLLAAVLLVLCASTALMIGGDAYWQMVLSFVLFGLVFGAALPLRAVVMGEWVATAVFGLAMGAQAAIIAGGRAAFPALAGVLHDGLDGYEATMALLSALLLVSAVLVAASGRRHAAPDPVH
ncbi:MAG TPA: MFS transporter [Solirubrobacteraceae bacterium]|nr:MFS transporter [Solirubrobacteraceae bacterium]